MLDSRNSRSLFALATLGLTASLAPVARAHFVLEAPAAVSEQNGLGDPQKAPPCGLDNSAVLTGARTRYVEGSKVEITINETIYHPGHYRVALALNDPSELPPEPPVTPGTTDCGSAPIDPNPVFPVLADGVLVHDARLVGPQTFEVTLPEGVTCENCTLQVLEFMSQHGLNNPGGCYYHHCANIEITPSGDPGGDGSGDGNGDGDGDLDAGTTPGDGDGDGSPVPDDGDGDESTGDGASADGSGADGSDAPVAKSSGGCAVGRGQAGSLALFALGSMALLIRRRRAG